jgi:hypothetical protein
MARTSPEQNKALVLEAFDVLFNRRDYATAERYWSDRYIQHSAHIELGHDGLFNQIRRCPTRCAMRTGSFSPRANTSSRTVVSPGVDGRRPGSLSTSSASKTASSPSIGMCFRTKRRKRSRRADSDVRRSLPGLICPLHSTRPDHEALWQHNIHYRQRPLRTVWRIFDRDWRDLSHRSLPRPIDRQVMPVGEARVE